MTNTKFPQCKTCNMTEEVQDFLNASREQGIGFKQMAQELLDVFEIGISDTSLGNHYKKHVELGLEDNMVLPPVTKNNTPKGYTPSVSLNEDGSGEVVTRPQAGEKLITDFSDALREMGVDPTNFVVEGTLGMTRWEQRSFDKVKEEYVTVLLSSYRVKIREKSKMVATETIEVTDREEYPLLYTVAEKLGERGLIDLPQERKDKDDNKTSVVIFSDPQVGKCGSRGGSDELIERVAAKHLKLEKYLGRMNSANAVFMDGGDIIEGFENTAQQMNTNDLSLMDQIDLAHTMELEFIDLLSRTHDRVDAMSVPSNHTAWRKGKDSLGKPGDDWGMHIMRQVEKVYDRYNAGHNVDFHYANEWQKSLVLDVQGYGLGLVHGDNVNKPDAIPQWWANQCHGGGPTALADILISAHFHCLRVQPSGRNAVTGNQKWWIGSPTMDNGSDWYANGMGGGDSDAGLLVFTIEKDLGFNIANLELL